MGPRDSGESAPENFGSSGLRPNLSPLMVSVIAGIFRAVASDDKGKSKKLFAI